MERDRQIKIKIQTCVDYLTKKMDGQNYKYNVIDEIDVVLIKYLLFKNRIIPTKLTETYNWI